MMRKSGKETAGELLAELQADPNWVAEKEKRDRELHERSALYRKAEEPLVRDLSLSGVLVLSVWDLVNTKAGYLDALPILLDHLMRPYPERVREGIARALAVPEARIGWKTLLEAFRQETDTTTLGVRWALALALGAAGSDDVLDDVLPLLRDATLGRNRVPLLQILARSLDPRANQLLQELRDDEAIGSDVRKTLRKFRPKKLMNVSSLPH